MAHEKKLNQLRSHGHLHGNDISSSCLYVSALSIGYAGQYAWVALLLVAGLLSFLLVSPDLRRGGRGPTPSTAARTTCS
ncbi:MAG: hypothetical protein WKG07_18955 [Hymenobacter sp.]